ncbi:MAG TPA: ClpX C4-type zinc finger protein [Pyrinomonadaceae bacterium]
MIKFRRLRCSFCRKNEQEVSKLVAGPRVYICDHCVAVASRMMEDDSHDDGQAKAVEPNALRKLLSRARRIVRGGDAHRVSSPTVSG